MASAVRRACTSTLVEVMALDLADLATVHRFAEALSRGSAGSGRGHRLVTDRPGLRRAAVRVDRSPHLPDHPS